MNIVADVIMTGETTPNYFGISVSSAGDVNGDSFSDVITGTFPVQQLWEEHISITVVLV